MATIQQLRGLFGGDSDAETIKLASQSLGLSAADIADELGFGSTGGKNTQRMSASVDSYQANLYGVGEDVAGAVGLKGAQNFLGGRRRANEAEAEIAQQRAKSMGSVDAFKDVHSASDFGDYAVGLGIQSLPYAAEAAAGGVLGRAVRGLAGLTRISPAVAGSAGVVGASYPSSVGDILSNQREQTGGQTDLLSAAALGVPYAAANVFGVEGALARGQLFRNGIKALDEIPGIRGGAARMVSSAGRTGLEEAGNETFQEFMNQGGRMAVDPSATFFNPESNDRFLESGIGGAVLGAATGGLLGGWRRERTHTNVPANLLPDAAPQTPEYTAPQSLTNTGVTEMPGFGSRPQDPLQSIFSPGPSVNINPSAQPGPTAPVNPAPDSQPTSRPNQPTEAPVTPEERQAAAEKYRAETLMDNDAGEGHYRVFGRDYFKRDDLNKALDKQAVEDRGVDPGLSDFEKTLNAEGTPFNRPAKLRELATSLYGSTPEKTAYNLNAAIASGHKEADRLAATYEKLTGQEAPAWKKLQEPKPTAAPKPAPAPVAAPAATEKVAPTTPTFEDDDFDGMAHATLMKLFNNNETNVQIALADLRGDKPADIQKQYGVSDSQVRKIRSRMAPKALELAARQAGVPLDKLQAAIAKQDATKELAGEEAVLAPDQADEKPLDSDERQLSQKTDEELTAEQQESDAFGSGLSVRTGSATQIADASAHNTSRAKLEAAKGNLMSKSLTPADLNNLWEEARRNEDDKQQLAVEREVLRRARAGELSQADLDELAGESDGVSPEETSGAAHGRQPVRTGRPAGESPAGQSAPVRQEGASRQTPGKKEPKGKVGSAWDKVVKQASTYKVDVPAWEKLTPEQRTKATDKYALNGKITLHEMQEVVGKKEAAPAPAPVARPAQIKIDEKSAASVAKVQRSTAPSTKEKTGSDFMAKLNAAAEAKKANKPIAEPMYAGEFGARERNDKERVANLQTAIKMSKAGEDMEKIRLATGWFKGRYDSKWRYEFSDKGAELNGWDKVEESKLFGDRIEVPLNVILKHPKLFEKYPAARNIKVIKQKGLFDFGGLQGWFDGKNNIGITPYAKDPLSTLLHEVQHWIQRQEGFATGGNEQMVFEALTPEQKTRLAEKIMPKMEEAVEREQENLKSLKLAREIVDWPEVKARQEADDEWSKVYNLPQKYLDEGGKKEDPLYEVHERAKAEALDALDEASRALDARLAQHLGLKAEPVYKGSSVTRVNFEPWQRMAGYQAKDGIEKIDKRIKQQEESLVKEQKALASLRSGDQEALKEAIKKSGEGYSLYKAIAGEIEARDTQARQNLTDEERAKTGPFTSETFDPKDVIVTYDKKGESRSLANSVRDRIAAQEAEKPSDFSQSKAVDENGQLMTLWHGSPSTTVEEALHGKKNFTEFDASKLGSNTGAPSSKLGFFFTDSMQNAGHYGGGGGMGNLATIIDEAKYYRAKLKEMANSILKSQVDFYKRALADRENTIRRTIKEGNLKPVNLNLVNPLVHDFGGKGYREESFAKLLEKAKAEGHDGAIFKNVDDPYNNTVYVVFDPKQIRTITTDVAIDQMSGNGVPKGWEGIDAADARETPKRSYAEVKLVEGEGGKQYVYSYVNDEAGFWNSTEQLHLTQRLMQVTGVSHLTQGLDGIGISEDSRTRFGSRGSYLRFPNGERFIDIAADTLESNQAPFVLLHELGHAADLILVNNGTSLGTFSGHPLFRMELKDGKIKAIGAVAKELQKLYESGEPAWEFLQYPFDTERHTRLNESGVHKELWAQTFAAYTINPELFEDAPLTSMAMERALNEIRKTNYAEKLGHAKRLAATPIVEQRPGGNVAGDRYAVEHIEEADGAPEVPRGRTQAGRVGGAQASRQAERLINELPQASRAGAKRLWTTINDAAKKGFYGAAFTWDLADIAKSKLPSVAQYMDLMGKKAAVKTHLEDKVEKILAASERIAKTDTQGRDQRGTGEHSVNRFIYDSTMQGKWGYQTDQASNIKVDPEMARRFEAFTPDAQALIKSIFQHGADTLRMKQKIIKEEINNEFRQRVKEVENDPDEVEKLERKRRAALAHYDSILFLSAGKPYSPLRRFGNYVVAARSQALRDAIANGSSAAIERMQADENHYFVAFYETLGQAEEQANRLRATGNYHDVSAFEKEKGLDAIHGGRDMMSAFDRLRNLIRTELEGDPGDQAMRSLNTMVSDLYLQTLAETSARKAELKRRNVAGADYDMLRAFATQGRADAHFIAALKHNGEVTDAMYDMRQQAHEPGEGKADRMRLFNEFTTRHALHMNYTEHRVQDAIMRGTSLWMLATSPAYYLQNATQTPMISIPYLAGKHGYGRSWAAVTQAYKDLGPMSEGLKLSERMDLSRAPADVRRMLDDLVAAGRIDIALDQDLGRFQSRSDSTLAHTWNTVDRKLRGMAQRVEAINRVTTAISAYRMELARNGGNHTAATEYASKAIRVTHGDYSAFNAPRYLTPGGGLPAAKVITQFRKFQIIQASLIVRLFNNSFSGDVSADERHVARKALLFTLGHTVAMGGMYGLPGASVLAFLATKLLGDPDEPDDDELKMRRLIGNQDLADLILKGAPAYMGVDLSGKLGMGTAFSLLPYAKLDAAKEGDNYKNALLGLSGPFFGGLLPRFINGVDEIEHGAWYKGLENMLPSGFGNAMKAYRFGDEGVTRKNGDVVMSPEEISFATELFQAMGLQTKQLTDRTFDQKVMTEFEQFYSDKEGRLTEKYARAAKQGDNEAMGKAREQWMELQDARVENGFKRQPLSTLLKAPVAQARRERQVVNHVGARSSRQLAEELGNI